MIELQNGARVLAADVAAEQDGATAGYVLAIWGSGPAGPEYVTWAVWRDANADRPEYSATAGHYFGPEYGADRWGEAVASYNERRAGRVHPRRVDPAKTN